MPAHRIAVQGVGRQELESPAQGSQVRRPFEICEEGMERLPGTVEVLLKDRCPCCTELCGDHCEGGIHPCLTVPGQVPLVEKLLVVKGSLPCCCLTAHRPVLDLALSVTSVSFVPQGPSYGS